MGKGILRKDGGVKFTATVALESGDMTALPDGRGCVVAGQGQSYAIGDDVIGYVEGVFELDKTSGEAITAGDLVFLDDSTGLATAVVLNGDRTMGICTKDAAAGDDRVWVDLGEAIIPVA